jgi:hypothetical protein
MQAGRDFAPNPDAKATLVTAAGIRQRQGVNSRSNMRELRRRKQALFTPRRLVLYNRRAMLSQIRRIATRADITGKSRREREMPFPF